ncbi:MAG: metalloprotease YbeY protein [Thermoleophilia bacterium]|nr:metalloprotease YbeY protein [Thermoleophilia bacterium]
MSAGDFQLACEVAWDRGVTAILAERHVQTLVAAALYEAGAEDGDSIELGVTFCDLDRSRELNLEHREIDAPTDVLSFPIDGLGDELPEGMPRELGDVVICPVYVKQQVADGATMLPHGPGQERGDATLYEALERCIVHGTLHLAGFDHERSDQDANEMFELEQLVLDRVRAVSVARE